MQFSQRGIGNDILVEKSLKLVISPASPVLYYNFIANMTRGGGGFWNASQLPKPYQSAQNRFLAPFAEQGM